MSECPFCAIVNDEASAVVLSESPHSMEIMPLGPVVEGHTIVIPKLHRSDALADPQVTAQTMHDAARWTKERRAEGSFNFITSVGVPATQSVFHLHIHVVPRSENDGLALPWYSGKSRKHKQGEPAWAKGPAAAPHMLEEAWDEGNSAGFKEGRWGIDNTNNPYRSQS